MAENQENVDRGDDFTPTLDEVIENDGKTVEKPAVEPPVEAKKPETEVKTEEKEPERDEKGKFIPRERLNEAVLKEREKAAALQARLTEAEKALEAQTTSQDIVEAQKTVKELIKQRNSHLGDGELDKATEIDAKIFELQEAIADRKAEIRVTQSRAQAVETMKYDVIVERLEADHPELDPDSDMYDEEMATEMRALMRGYQSELKLSAAQALSRAAKRMFPPAAKKEAASEEKKEEKVAEEGLRRKTEATERNLDAAKKQPASTKEVGLDHDKKGGGLDAKTVMGLPYSEFVKVGDDVLSKLRGDTL